MVEIMESEKNKSKGEPLAGIDEEAEGGAKSGNIWLLGVLGLLILALVGYTLFSGNKEGNGSSSSLTQEEKPDAQPKPGFFKRMQNWYASKRKGLEDSLVNKCGMSQKAAERTVTGAGLGIFGVAAFFGGWKLHAVYKKIPITGNGFKPNSIYDAVKVLMQKSGDKLREVRLRESGSLKEKLQNDRDIQTLKRLRGALLNVMHVLRSM